MRLYFATLGPGSPKGALGLYEHATGALIAYSAGKEWFFHAAGGAPAFYMADGVPYLPDGLWPASTLTSHH